MRWIIFLFLLGVTSYPVSAQELCLLGGIIQDTDTHKSSYSWQLEYLEPLSEHLQFTVSYLNEGHFPDHHRDGNSLQLWARTSMFDRRLSLAAGAGPYYYFDTTSQSTSSYANDHGWGAMASVAATWYTDSRWLFQLHTNWVGTDGSIDTLSAVFGIGYQLGSPSYRLQSSEELSQEKTTNSEVTVFVGRTIVNSFGSEHSIAEGVEYRRGIWKYVDWTVGYLHEGDDRLTRRDGFTTELWGVRSFFDDTVALGIGGGVYVTADHQNPQQEKDDELLAGIITLTASYRFPQHWDIRTSWNRIVTNYDADTDVILAGIGYRF